MEAWDTQKNSVEPGTLAGVITGVIANNCRKKYRHAPTTRIASPRGDGGGERSLQSSRYGKRYFNNKGKGSTSPRRPAY